MFIVFIVYITKTLVWRWVVSFILRPLYPQEWAHSSLWIRGWVGPRANPDEMEKRKLFTLQVLELRTLSRPTRSRSQYRLIYRGSTDGIRRYIIAVTKPHVFRMCLFNAYFNNRPPLWSSGQGSWLQNGDVLCFQWGMNWIFICYVEESRQVLWCSGQGSWLQNGDVLCFQWDTNWIYICYVEGSRPPMLSSGQGSWLQNGYVLCFQWDTNWIYICYVEESRPPMWSSGQGSWLQNGGLLCFLWGTIWIYMLCRRK
jgi:hypothetical protein